MNRLISMLTRNIPTAEIAAGIASRGMEMAWIIVCIIFASVRTNAEGVGKAHQQGRESHVPGARVKDFSILEGDIPPIMPQAKASIIMQAPR